jgi:hypothetical protein
VGLILAKGSRFMIFSIPRDFTTKTSIILNSRLFLRFGEVYLIHKAYIFNSIT